MAINYLEELFDQDWLKLQWQPGFKYRCLKTHFDLNRGSPNFVSNILLATLTTCAISVQSNCHFCVEKNTYT